MTEYSRPFQLPDVGGVPQGYNEAQTREYMNWIMKQNGIRRSSATWATGDLFVYPSTPAAMTVKVAVGGVWINGGAHDSTAIETLTIDAAHGTLDRTDSVVARMSIASPNSAIVLAILKGDNAAAGTSVAKALTQNATAWELRLATVLVSAAVTSIAGTGTTLITDTRLTAECGIAAPQLGFFSIDATNGNLAAGGKRGTGFADPVDDQDVDTKAARVAAISALSFAPLADPTFTGVPAAPTAAGATSTTQIATTEFVMKNITYGSYSGNNTENRAIAHGAGKTPGQIIIIGFGSGASASASIVGTTCYNASSNTNLAVNTTVTTPDTTNFYVGENKTGYYPANHSGFVYFWVAYS